MDSPGIDFSAGDPSFSFKAAADYACNVTEHDMRRYSAYTQGLLSNYMGCSKGFFDEMGLTKPDLTGVDVKSLSVTHGTTHGFQAVLQLIKKRFDAFQDLTQKRELTPVILLVLPTYGRLLVHPEENGMNLVPLKRDPRVSWKLDAHLVSDTLADIRASGNQMAVAFFDSNPHNPTGLVRGADETHALAEVFLEHNEIMRSAHANLGPQAHLLTRLNIIDDMVYYGLEYDNNRKPISFMTNAALYDSTYLLLGTSKMGLAALRSGLVVCNEEDTAQIRQTMVNNCYCPNITTLRAASFAFSASTAEACERQQHLDKLREAHIYGEVLLRSLINGIPEAELSSSAGHRMLSHIVPVTRSVDCAKHLLTNGIKDLELMTKPESGFFHLAKVKDGSRMRYEGEPVDNDDRLEALLKDYGVLVATSKWCGWDKKGLFLRLSYGNPTEDTVRCVVRTKTAFEAARI